MTRCCDTCEVPFTARELRSSDAIHRDPDTLLDVHAACCTRCNPPPTVTWDDLRATGIKRVVVQLTGPPFAFVQGLAPEVW